MRIILFAVFLLLAFVAVAISHEHYAAHVIRVIDGDTFVANILIDPYYKIQKEDHIRVARVDCPEVRGSEKVEGFKVKALVEKKILDKKVKLVNLKKGKFGRPVAEVLLEEGYYLSDWLLQEGLCKKYE